MKILFSTFVLSWLLACILAQTCTPPYWQSLGPVISINQCDASARQNITLESVIHQKTNITTKNYWNLTNIRGTSSGSSSNVSVTSLNNTIVVSNYLINVNLSMDITRKSGNKQTYNGAANANIQILVAYSKQVIASQKEISFRFVSLNYNINVLDINYSTTPSANDKTQFDNLIKLNVTSELRDYEIETLSPSVKEQIESYKINLTTFNSTYNYQFNNFSAKYQMNIESMQITNKTALVLGYNATIDGSQDPTCSNTSKPFDEGTLQASFFSKQFCQDLLKYATSSPYNWIQVLIDSNYKTTTFQFQMKDIVPIIPDAVKAYPGLFAKVYAKCDIVSSQKNTLTFDPFHNQIRVGLGWNCTLFRTGGYGLLGFYISVDYTTIVGQQNSSIIHNTTSAFLKQTKLYKLQFGIENQKIAQSYIASVLSSMSPFPVIGTNFTQPPRAIPKITFTDTFIKISDASRSSHDTSLTGADM